jgi:hypothetical protein
MECVQCENPLVKFIEYVDTQITVQGITTQVNANLLVQNLLSAGYFVSNKINNNLCCPDCPIENCDDGVYFIGNLASFITFAEFMGLNTPRTTRLCCTNYYLDVDGYASFYETVGCTGIYSCCNKFESECLNNYLTFANEIEGHYATYLTQGLVEYSVIDGNSALCDIITALESSSTLCQLAFLQIGFGSAGNGMVVSCGCRPGYTGVMNLTRFTECGS